MDPENPVIQLCVRGMQAEAEARPTDAHDLFQQAWEMAGDDYEACVAAHYLARHQPTPAKTLQWNQECLRRAELVADGRVAAFYPSLHLNMARAHGDLGQLDQSHKHFLLAAEYLHTVPHGQYADWLRCGIAEGLRTTTGTTPRPADALLMELLTRLCGRVDLRALGLILPAYVGDLGTEEDRLRLVTALKMVQAARWLPDDEQSEIGRVISSLNASGAAAVS